MDPEQQSTGNVNRSHWRKVKRMVLTFWMDCGRGGWCFKLDLHSSPLPLRGVFDTRRYWHRVAVYRRSHYDSVMCSLYNSEGEKATS